MQEDGRDAPSPPFLPISPARVARIGHGGGFRFWLAWGVALLTVAAVVLQLAHVGWFPAIETALTRLPSNVGIDQGRLRWPDPDRRVLADNGWLTIVVDPRGRWPGIQAGDLQLDFTADALWATGTAGHLRLPYPTGRSWEFEREVLVSRWAAWRPYLLLGTGLAASLVLAGVQAMVAGFLTPFLWLYARVIRRTGSGPGIWRAAILALLPGAIILAVALFLYSFRAMNLLHALLAGLIALFWVVPALVFAPWHLPREARVVPPSPSTDEHENPFRPSARLPASPPRNPFAGTSADTTPRE